VKLPKGFTVTRLQNDGQDMPIRQTGNEVQLMISPGAHLTQMHLQSHQAIGLLNRSTALDFGRELANIELIFKFERDRWILALGGPAIGPAVLFWGIVVLIVMVSFALSRISWTPLRFYDWLLLGLGFAITASWTALLLGALLLMMGKRAKLDPEKSVFWFDFIQVFLIIFTVATGLALIQGISHGLLGRPNMQIAQAIPGELLHWYQDKANMVSPRAWVLTVPMWYYRLLMLLWSLWFVFALVRWLPWMWKCFSAGGVWIAPKKILMDKKPW
jgi:hypothetical protein